MSTRTIDRVKKKARNLTEEDRREAAAKEARRRWEEVRSTIASTADHVSDVAEEQWGHARDAASPTVKRIRQKAADVIETDLDWLRHELSDVSGEVGRNLLSLGSDVKDASRAEANRIIAAIHDNAEKAREEERKRRVRALVGWTAFGMVAGAVLAIQFGPKQTEVEVTAVEGPVEGQDGLTDEQPTSDADATLTDG